MKIEELAVKLYNDFDYNCAESVLHAADEYYGLGLPAEAFLVIGPWGGGCGCGNLCGAVAGALGAIGRMRIKTVAHQSDANALSAAFIERYKKAMGSEQCVYLKEKYNTAEERCSAVIAAAAKLLKEIMDEQEALDAQKK